MTPTERRPPVERLVTAVAIVLVAVAVIALWPSARSGPSGTDATEAVVTTTSPADPPARGISEVAPTSTTLPPPPADVAPGTFVAAPGSTLPVGSGSVQTYTVEVETATGVDPVQFATAVDATLADPRSWIADGSLRVQRVAEGGAARIVLATPGTTDAMCAPLQTAGRFSCGQGSTAVINLERWTLGVDVWPGPLDDYRHYVVNHEFGHVLGHGHVGCPGADQLAPVMMQQSKGVDSCLPNGWPYP